MAELLSTYGLVEMAKRRDPDGSHAKIAEVLNREAGMIFAEAPWVMSNDNFTHKTTRRGTLPGGSRRKLNQRISASVSRTTEVMDVMENIEDYLDVDAMVVKNDPSPGEFLAGEVDAFIEGIGQTGVSDVLYADSNADPDAMHGLAARLGTVDGRFVMDAGGTGSDLMSVFVVSWGKTLTHLIYPRNMAANMGVVHEDKGWLTSETTNGLMEIHRDHFALRFGMSVRHPRSIGRVANIMTTGTSNTFDEDDLITLLNNMVTGPVAALENGSTNKTRIYVNEVLLTQMQIRAKDKNNINYTPSNGLAGEPPLYFNGYPIRPLSREIQLITEDAITT